MTRPPFLFPAGSAMGADNLVLHARAKRHQVSDYAGPLSIKTVLDGRVAWIVAGRELVVDESSFLILAAGEKYSMNIDSYRPIETCCVFFQPGYVESVVRDATSLLSEALDDPERAAPGLPWLSALHGDDERRLVSRVRNLARRAEQGIGPSAHEEQFLLGARELLDYYERIRTAVARVPAVKESTRHELFRRLLIGREFLHAHVSGPVWLREAARAACLSPFHFHRGFVSAFGQTPHEYLTALRLERARLAIGRRSSVTEASLEAGFLSPSAFSRAFRKRFGEPPSAARP